MPQAIFRKHATRLFVTVDGDSLKLKLSADRTMDIEFAPADLKSAEKALDAANENLKKAIVALEKAADASPGVIRDLTRRREAAELASAEALTQVLGASLVAALAKVASKELSPKEVAPAKPVPAPKNAPAA